jgi:HTH-type transcriptional repressor of NAD biosynthesis genes
MTTGFVLGKFYPPHAGHYLIDTALSEMDRVVVLVCWSECESYHDRWTWVQDRHPEAIVIPVQDEHPIDYSDAGWRAHLAVWTAALPCSITHVYTSESYGDELALRLGVQHRLVDLDREKFLVSGTLCRRDPQACWSHFAPATRAAMTQRFVICGAESSGTTTLAKALSKELRTAWVPEYGRTLTESLERSDSFEWNTDAFEEILREQAAMEDRYARYAGPQLICDTDAYATAMFHELYLGRPLDIRDRVRYHSLYLITDHEGVEFEQDGERRFGEKRAWQTEWLKDRLARDRLPFAVISGSHAERVEHALKLIRRTSYLRVFEFPEPIEYGGRSALEAA